MGADGMVKSQFLSKQSADDRKALEQRLFQRQSGHCFICDAAVDLVLHKGELEIDHIAPLATGGADAENNFALVHESCNRSKGADDLRVARRIKDFEKIEAAAKKAGGRGANLGHVLARYGGAKVPLRLKRSPDRVEFVLSESGDHGIRVASL